MRLSEIRIQNIAILSAKLIRETPPLGEVTKIQNQRMQLLFGVDMETDDWNAECVGLDEICQRILAPQCARVAREIEYMGMADFVDPRSCSWNDKEYPERTDVKRSGKIIVLATINKQGTLRLEVCATGWNH